MKRLLALSLSLPLATVVPAAAQSGKVRIVQTNSAGDNVHIIDPATNQVVQVIEGIPKAHGVAAAPDGSTLYFSNEIHRTLEIVPTDVMEVVDRIPLSGRPHNVAISNDGRKVYVAIIQGCSCVDVVDLERGEVVKSIRTLGTVHNVFMSPDGRHVAAGMIGARTLTIIDTSIDEAIWSLHFSGRTTGGYADGGVRPMAFETHADGSTKRLFIQISNYHGVYVVDFAQRKVVQKLDIAGHAAASPAAARDRRRRGVLVGGGFPPEFSCRLAPGKARRSGPQPAPEEGAGGVGGRRVDPCGREVLRIEG